jgi:hypothetical protein
MVLDSFAFIFLVVSATSFSPSNPVSTASTGEYHQHPSTPSTAPFQITYSRQDIAPDHIG